GFLPGDWSAERPEELSAPMTYRGRTQIDVAVDALAEREVLVVAVRGECHDHLGGRVDGNAPRDQIREDSQRHDQVSAGAGRTKPGEIFRTGPETERHRTRVELVGRRRAERASGVGQCPRERPYRAGNRVG